MLLKCSDDVEYLKKEWKSYWAYFVLICCQLYFNGFISKELFRRCLKGERNHLLHRQAGQLKPELNLFLSPEQDFLFCPEFNPLYVIGDSHCLSVAWKKIKVKGEVRTIIPLIVTGLKAWHVKPETPFFTHSALLHALKSLPPSTKEVLFACGEIDCREGILNATNKGKYPDIDIAVQRTVEQYVYSLAFLGVRFGLKFYIMPVPPQISRKQRKGRWKQRQQRNQTIHRFNIELKKFGAKPAVFCPDSGSFEAAVQTITEESLCNSQSSGGTVLTPSCVECDVEFEVSACNNFAKTKNPTFINVLPVSDYLVYLDYYKELCTPTGYLVPEFDADGTHLNSSFLHFLERELNNCNLI